MIDTVLQPGDARGLRWYRLLFAAACIVVCVPVWAVEYPPLVDYPNHLARNYVLYHYDEFEVFQQRYERNTVLLPNLAMEAFVLPLQVILPIEIAGKIFLSLVLLIFCLGCHCLGKAIHGQPTWLAFAGFFFCYNSMWFYGFVNFCFGLGMFFLATAGWLVWRRSPAILGGVGVAVLVFLCYLSHISAYFFVTGTVLAIVAWSWLGGGLHWPQARLFLQLLPVLPEMVFFLAGGGGGGVMRWNSLQGKLVGSLCLVLTYDNRFDLAVLVALFALAAIVVWRSRSWSADGGVLFAGAGCLAGFLASPREVFTGDGADARFVPVGVVLLLLGCRFQLPASTARGVLAGLLTLTLCRLAFVTVEWTAASQQIAAQVAVLDNLPMDARLYPAVMRPEVADYSKRDRCCFHVANYATIRRHAFCPMLFAFSTQQPIRFKNTSAGQRSDGARLESALAGAAPYDFVLCFDVPDSEVAFLQAHFDPVCQGGNSALYRARKAR